MKTHLLFPPDQAHMVDLPGSSRRFALVLLSRRAVGRLPWIFGPFEPFEPRYRGAAVFQ